MYMSHHDMMYTCMCTYMCMLWYMVYTCMCLY